MVYIDKPTVLEKHVGVARTIQARCWYEANIVGTPARVPAYIRRIQWIHKPAKTHSILMNINVTTETSQKHLFLWT
jgi:hypothetical protein